MPSSRLFWRLPVATSQREKKARVVKLDHEINSNITPTSIVSQLIYDSVNVHVDYATQIGRMVFLHGLIMKQVDVEIQFPAGTNLVPLIVLPGQNYDAWANKDYQCFVGIGIAGNKIFVNASELPYHYTIINVVVWI